jgi:hypothetical protein
MFDMDVLLIGMSVQLMCIFPLYSNGCKTSGNFFLRCLARLHNLMHKYLCTSEIV